MPCHLSTCERGESSWRHRLIFLHFHFPDHKRQNCRESLDTVLIETVAMVSFSADFATIISTMVICHLKDPDRVPLCRPPHANNTSFNSVSLTTVTSDTWPSRCPSQRRPPGDHPHRQPPRMVRGMVVVHGSWRGSNFNVVARCFLYFTKSISAICHCQCSSRLRCCRFSMSHVHIGQTLVQGLFYASLGKQQIKECA